MNTRGVENGGHVGDADLLGVAGHVVGCVAAAVAALVPDDNRTVDAQCIDIAVPHARGGTETVREQQRHTRRLRVVHLESQRHPVWPLQSVHWTTSEPHWMAGYRASGPQATNAAPSRPAQR